MALFNRKNGLTSVILRIFLPDSSSSTGAGLTGLTSSSNGLIISTIADNEATATSYAVASSKVESITTLGTFAAPTSTKCRFKEVDATNFPGVYEIQIADARYAVSSARSLLVSVVGASNLAPTYTAIQLDAVDNMDTVRGGMTSLPNAAAEAAGGLYTQGSGAGQIAQAANGTVNVNATKLSGTSLTARDIGASVTTSFAIKKNTALAGFEFVMFDSTNHNPVTSLTVTATRSIDGGAFGSSTNAVVEVSAGVYKINLSAADLNGDTIMFKFVATGADTQFVEFVTQT